MNRIADYSLTAKLRVKRALNASSGEIDSLLDVVCNHFWKATLDDIPERDFWEVVPRLDEDEAIELASAHGFDLTEDNEELLPDWPSFSVMIWAMANGILTTQHRWKAEAEASVRKDQKLYRISGFDRTDNHCFAFPEGVDGKRVFLHHSTLRKAGLSDPKADDLLMLEVGEGPRGLFARTARIAAPYELKAAYTPTSRRLAIDREYVYV